MSEASDPIADTPTTAQPQAANKTALVNKQYRFAQYGVLGFGLVLFILLLLAEKTPPLSNNPQKEAAAQSSEEGHAMPNSAPANSGASAGNTANAELSFQSLPDYTKSEVLNRLVKALDGANNTDTKRKALDNLRAAALSENRPDIAALAHEQILSLNNTKSDAVTQKRSAELYRDAANFGLLAPEQANAFRTKAITAYEVLAKNSPEDLDTQVELGVLYVNSPNPMDGIRKLREVTEKAPGHFRANLELGKFSLQTGQIDKAVNRLEQAIKTQPQNWEAHFFLGMAKLRAGDKKAAKTEMEIARKNAPSDDIRALITDQINSIQ